MKLVPVCCALFALLAPAAQAADRTPPSVPTGLRVVSVTEDSLTLAWNASTDNSGSIHHYVVSPGAGTRGTDDQDDTGFVPSYTRDLPRRRGRRGGQRVAAERAADRDHGAGRDRADAPGRAAADGVSPSSISLAWDRSFDRWSFSYEILRRLGRDRERELDLDAAAQAPARDHSLRCGRATSAATSRGRVAR